MTGGRAASADRDRHRTVPSREAAARIAAALAQSPAVQAVWLFGSVARGNHTPDSDLDLLVLGTDPTRTVGGLLAELPAPLRTLPVSLVYYTRRELDRLVAERSSFLLHVAREGAALVDPRGELAELLAGVQDGPPDVARELTIQRRRLAGLEDMSQFNGNLLFCLGQLYGIARTVAILKAIAGGDLEFQRDRAFESVRRRHPELGTDLELLQELRPFYRRVTRGDDVPLPFDYEHCERRAADAIAAIHRLAAAER